MPTFLAIDLVVALLLYTYVLRLRKEHHLPVLEDSCAPETVVTQSVTGQSLDSDICFLPEIRPAFDRVVTIWQAPGAPIEDVQEVSNYVAAKRHISSLEGNIYPF
jgi:hypothetical protein